ncbi:MAG: NAD(P)H-hydrate epimerase [Paracoccaceae bacterium]
MRLLQNIYPVITDLPCVTTDQMIEVDRRMMEEVGISLFQMMENAGLQLANVARDMFLGGDVMGKRIAVLAGTGGNGGGAIVAARRLVNWGATCDVALSRTADVMSDVPRAQFEILNKIGNVDRIEPQDLASGYDLILDGLIGYSLNGAPRGKVADFIHATHSTATPVLSLDVPSGYDGAEGVVLDPCIRAATTLTLGLPKLGMTGKDRSEYVGRLLCADISCPSAVFADLGLNSPYRVPFSSQPVVEVG